MTRLFAAFITFTTLAVPAAAWAADTANGQRLAERWCAACHVVAASQQHGSTQAPPFSEIAKKKNLSDASLALFLLRPHPKMPDMSLSRAEAADLAADIKAQAK